MVGVLLADLYVISATLSVRDGVSQGRGRELSKASSGTFRMSADNSDRMPATERALGAEYRQERLSLGVGARWALGPFPFAPERAR